MSESIIDLIEVRSMMAEGPAKVLAAVIGLLSRLVLFVAKFLSAELVIYLTFFVNIIFRMNWLKTRFKYTQDI